jgi:hypothetical protein
MSTTANTNAAPAPEPEKPRTIWESILTSTPVVLTVVATLLAGLSSSEMTRAQYYRSLAAQNQSKVGDQWNFFQAKRIRGGSAETEVELLRAQHVLGPTSAEAIEEYLARLPSDFDRTVRVGERLSRALDAIKPDSGVDSPKPAVEKLVQTARQNMEQARTLQKSIAETLAKPEVREALTYLNTDKLPEAAREKIGAENIRIAGEAVKARKTEAELAPLMAAISDDELREARETAERNAKGFEEVGKPVEQSLKSVSQLIKEATALTGAVHQLSERVVAIGVTEIAAGQENGKLRTAVSSDGSAELRDAAAALGRIDTAMTKNADEIKQAFLAAHREFTARRYEREARDIQAIGDVYEIQVEKSSWQSERHRKRSQLFFIGMLTAQAGTVIASFSLALKQRSTLWALAATAGVGAIAFSAWVYLFT